MTKSVTVISKTKFDAYCKESNIFDYNVDNIDAYAFISICTSLTCRSYYYDKFGEDDFHYFKDDHHNVINLDFDDVEEDGIYQDIPCLAINEKQAIKLVDFIEKNKNRNFVVHCRAGKSRSRAIGLYIVENYDHMPIFLYGNDLSERGNIAVLSSLNKVNKSILYQDLNFEK